MENYISTYKEAYQLAKQQRKIPLLKNILEIYRSDLLSHFTTIFALNYEETFDFLMRNSMMTKKHEGFIKWLDSWEWYLKNTTEGPLRLKHARKNKQSPIFQMPHV